MAEITLMQTVTTSRQSVTNHTLEVPNAKRTWALMTKTIMDVIIWRVLK